MSLSQFEKRKSVRFTMRLRIKYSIHLTGERIKIHHAVQGKDNAVNIDANIEQETPHDIKEGMTIDISTNGVLFETKDKPGLDKVCKLEILLPQEALTALGKISKVDELVFSGEKRYRVGVKFTKIAESDINRICLWYYKSKLNPDFDHPTSERRERRRFKVKGATLKYRKRHLLVWGDWSISHILDVSPGGILFKSKEDFRVNEILLVEMQFAAYNKPIKALGKVIRVRRSQLEFANEVAIILSKVSQEDKKKLDEPRYLDSLVNKAGKTAGWF